MSRAQVKVEANEKIGIEGVPYRVAEHPALPGIPYVQRGARGFVIQLVKPDSERMALKYFKLKYRVPELVDVAGALRRYADLPGLRAARRTVFTHKTHAELTTRYPALEYGMLMPWLPGVTWYDLVTTKTPITPQEGLQLAQETSRILATLEAQGLAHCDIAGANVMIERRGAQVELVDIEEMYGPDLPRPVETPAGQDGYQHRSSREHGQWMPEGDRFGAAVLLAEILTWPDGRIRVNSADEHFFATTEMQDPDSVRYRLMREVLQDEYGPDMVELFEAAWCSSALRDCPPLAAWRDALAGYKVEARHAQPTAFTGSPIVTGRRAVGPVLGAAPAPHDVAGNDRETPLNLEGVRLCRNCGAQNSTRETFCARCGFYIGIGLRRPPPLAAARERPPPAAAAAPVSAPPPRAVKLNRNLQEIVVARRVGNPGRGMQRIELPKPEVEQIPANAGQWIVLAIIIGLVLTILALSVMAG